MAYAANPHRIRRTRPAPKRQTTVAVMRTLMEEAPGLLGFCAAATALLAAGAFLVGGVV